MGHQFHSQVKWQISLKVVKAKFIIGQIGGCPNTEACNDLDTGDCPIEAGEEFIYNMQMKIESYFPPVSIQQNENVISILDIINISIILGPS